MDLKKQEVIDESVKLESRQLVSKNKNIVGCKHYGYHAWILCKFPKDEGYVFAYIFDANTLDSKLESRLRETFIKKRRGHYYDFDCGCQVLTDEDINDLYDLNEFEHERDFTFDLWKGICGITNHDDYDWSGYVTSDQIMLCVCVGSHKYDCLVRDAKNYLYINIECARELNYHVFNEEDSDSELFSSDFEKYFD